MATGPPEKYLVLGAGLSGLGAAKLLKSLDKDVLIYNDFGVRDTRAVRDARRRGIQFSIGDSAAVDVGQFTRVIASPMWSTQHGLIRAAFSLGKPVIDEIELAWESIDAETICVTGTNGKSTTTRLIEFILKSADREALAVGNIGVSYSEKAMAFRASGRRPTFVVEACSFQLERTERFRPNVAVWLNTTEDHLDRHSSMTDYASAKSRVTSNQREGDVFIYNIEDKWAGEFSETSNARTIGFCADPENPHYKLPKLDSFPLDTTIARDTQRIFQAHPNFRSLENCLAAVAVGVSVGLPPDQCLTALNNCKRTPPYRLKEMGTLEGVKFFCDAAATNPAAVALAVRNLPGPLIVICGGTNKIPITSSHYTAIRNLWKEFIDKIKSVLVFGASADEFRAAWRDTITVQKEKTFDDAFHAALSKSRCGDTVIFAPCCSPEPEFDLIVETGARFRKLLNRARAGGPHLPQGTS